MPDLITDFIRQNEWANHALIEACRDLTDEQLDATVDGVYGSIRATWRHITRAEGGYASQLGHPPGYELGSDDWPGWDALAEMATAAADALVAAAGEPADQTFVSRDEKWTIERTVVIVQAVHHGTDHRSQICTLLTSLGVEPPDWSAWGWGVDTGRMTRA
jgi:uncharacterized damage-inducible protein DinB